MKILYFGTVCDLSKYEEKLNNCKEKPSVATIIFEEALLSGFSENKTEVEVYSYPMIPMFPKSKLLCWGNIKEVLACGYKCTWLRTINIPFVKQIIRKIDGKCYLKKWLRKNCNERCAVVTYSIPPFLVKDIIKNCNKYNVKCFAIVTDLLRDMYINAHDNKYVRWLKNKYLSRAIQLQGNYDGYVYLVKGMSEVINPKKPYIVVEGVANVNVAEKIEKKNKAVPLAIMYAGMLEKKYGIINLINAFEKAGLGDTELWLFGTGDAVSEIMSRAMLNNKIRFGGRKTRDEILELEKRATLLVNPRSIYDEFTKYSFPSKTIEYMLSGTPMLTTKLEGIPEEYYDYLFSCKDNDIDSIKESLEKIMNLSDEERNLMGKRARNFIVENKSNVAQAKRILDFMSEVI